MIAEIRARSGRRRVTTAPVQLMVPDILMHPPGWGLADRVNPRRCAAAGERAVHSSSRTGAKGGIRFLTEHLSANWLVRSLQQRAQTILKVAAGNNSPAGWFLARRCASAAVNPA
jgi:RNA polymerase sigma-54 factor